MIMNILHLSPIIILYLTLVVWRPVRSRKFTNHDQWIIAHDDDHGCPIAQDLTKPGYPNRIPRRFPGLFLGRNRRDINDDLAHILRMPMIHNTTDYPPLCITPHTAIDVIIHCHKMPALPNRTNAKCTPDMKTAYMSGNNWPNIPAYLFQPWWRVTSLDLSNNKIHSLDDHAFNPLREVTIIKLNHNRIREVRSPVFGYCVSLTSLYLQNNRIKTVDLFAFQYNKLLEVLRLENNRIYYLSSYLFSFTPDLKTLHLQNNQPELCHFVRNIPEHVTELKLPIVCSNAKTTQARTMATTMEKPMTTEKPVTDHCQNRSCNEPYGLCEITADEKAAACICQDGHTGANCEIAINPCLTVYCGKGIACMPRGSDYICILPETTTKTAEESKPDDTPMTLLVSLLSTVAIVAILVVAYFTKTNRKMRRSKREDVGSDIEQRDGERIWPKGSPIKRGKSKKSARKTNRRNSVSQAKATDKHTAALALNKTPKTQKSKNR